jgi:hypothetical protein
LVKCGFSKESEEYVFLIFINLFYQGKLFKAVDFIQKTTLRISLTNVIFWQTYAFALKAIDDIHSKEGNSAIQGMISNLEGKELILQEQIKVIQQKDIDLIHAHQIIEQKEKELTLMMASKFWKLRDKYVRLKSFFGK